jgi:hypothetical protein
MQILMNNTQEAILDNFDQTCLYNINENKPKNYWFSHLIGLYSLMYRRTNRLIEKRRSCTIVNWVF